MTYGDWLRERGYRPIASEAHATQLLRREIKRMRAAQQRHGNLHGVDYPRMLSIRPGTWYRFVRSCGVSQAGLVLIREPEPTPSAENPNAPGK